MNIDSSFIFLVGGLTLVIVLIFSLVIILPMFFLRKHSDVGSVFYFFIEQAYDLKMFTVLTIVASTSLLALTGIIDGTAAVAILSGIVGYVLGGIKGESNNKIKLPNPSTVHAQSSKERATDDK